MKFVLLTAFLLTVCVAGHGQKVSASKKVLADIPESARATLKSRLEAYIRAVHIRDIGSLFEVVSDRAKRGMSREEFLKQVTAHPEEIYLQSFKILQVRKGEYIDEPTPRPGEGEKWSVSGCGKYSIDGAKAKRYLGHFDIWLVNGTWYVRRGGLRLGDGGYQECKD